jgi:hypothetical protein
MCYKEAYVRVLRQGTRVIEAGPRSGVVFPSYSVMDVVGNLRLRAGKTNGMSLCLEAAWCIDLVSGLMLTIDSFKILYQG